jgi:hypothetical protein
MYNEMEVSNLAEIFKIQTGGQGLFIKNVKILSLMDKDQAGEIIGALEPEQAIRYVQALTTLRQEGFQKAEDVLMFQTQ